MELDKEKLEELLKDPLADHKLVNELVAKINERKYTHMDGVTYDLDDPETYKNLPQTIEEVKERLYKEIGYSQLYLIGTGLGESDRSYIEKYKVNQIPQADRVQKLIDDIAKVFGDHRCYNYNQLIWWQEKLFLFLDEIENMC